MIVIKELAKENRALEIGIELEINNQVKFYRQDNGLLAFLIYPY